ncbi:hypothetical protein AALP_AA5G179900 [Arabis alpina]|uniref:Uncharacterized protein n=1 Tax=Arabis alpina TaxID=50452 RepID=A0A087GXU5_ARAAL|nr:hypothetical protein AALP_AA5G179900 [Arabis alpina]
MQSADDASPRGSAPHELSEPKGHGDASRSKGKGKVDPVDKKAEKKMIAAKAKADLKAGRITTFRIGGTCEVLPSEAPIAQSLGIIPPASLHVNSDSAAIPPCPPVQTTVNVSHIPPPRAPSLTLLPIFASKLSSESSLSKRTCTTERAGSPKARADSWEVSANANRQSADDYAAQLEVLKGEKQRLEDEVKKRDVHLEAASAEIAGLRADLEKSRLTEDRLRKESNEARRRAEITSGSSARGARHSSCLERIRLYLIALHAQEEVKAQLCYRRGARMSLEKMVEAEYELPPGLLENYIKEEEEYITKVESFDPLGDDTLFPTLPPPPAGLLRDVTSDVPDGISEHGSFLSPQDNHDGGQI